MKVLHSGTFDVNAGGPAMSTYLTTLGLRQAGVDAQMFMYPVSEGGSLRGEAVPVHYASAPIDGRMLYSPSYKSELRALGKWDIYHAQGLWQYPTYALCDVARGFGRPYLITPRGMLYPQDIAKSNTFFKRLSLKLRLLRDLNRAACVHVTCEQEMIHCRNLGVTSPIAVVPNPVEIKKYPYRKQDDVFRVGYLGRLSPRKNVEGLIYAFASLREELAEAELLIIGGGDREYESFLRGEVERLSLSNVRFLGFLSGEEKDRALASLSIMAMPSEFENLGNVILESLVRGIPAIATHGSPWSELESSGCGWWVEYRQDAITDAIGKASRLSKRELEAMGSHGSCLMECCYSVEAVASKMKQLYGWILSEESRPEFVYEQP